MPRFLSVVVPLLAITAPAPTQTNGKLQIHFKDVGQGDGAVLISPQGEVVLFDNGVLNQCTVLRFFPVALARSAPSSPWRRQAARRAISWAAS